MEPLFPGLTLTFNHLVKYNVIQKEAKLTDHLFSIEDYEKYLSVLSTRVNQWETFQTAWHKVIETTVRNLTNYTKQGSGTKNKVIKLRDHPDSLFQYGRVP